jgi:4-amino-4-deoxy-L-arabinose transferase-like glycosyltransferase
MSTLKRSQKAKKKSRKRQSTSIPEKRRINWGWMILIGVLLFSAFLRFYDLHKSPLGFNVDEAVNAWNAYCLEKTGMDQHGIHWPIFDSAGFGQGMSTLYLYMVVPFQAVGGLNALTTRIPAAFCGVLTVFLIFYVGKRLFGCWTGLAAAALLAVNPWHLQNSRWGHMGNLFPLLTIAPLAALLWARLPVEDRPDQEPRPLQAALAGAILGIGCFGYYAARLWLPVFYSCIVLIQWPAWRRQLKTRRGAFAIVGFILLVLLTFGPLVYKSLTTQLLEKRAEATWVWSPTDSPSQKVLKVVSRYPGHYGLDFLFRQGDPDVAYAPPSGYGLFYWYTLPLMIAGLLVLLWRAKRSPAARVLLVWVALYPAADLLNEHPTMHALRSIPGICCLTLLAAVGAVFLGKWLWEQHRPMALVVASLAAVIFFISSGRFFYRFYGEFNREPARFFVGRQDLLDTCQWLKPRLKDVDAVFVTSTGIGHPYIYTLVGLQYDPHQWFKDPKEFIEGPLRGGIYKNEKVCLRYGKMHFMFGGLTTPALNALYNSATPQRVLFVVRPGESNLESEIPPIYHATTTWGETSLLVFEVTLGGSPARN